MNFRTYLFCVVLTLVGYPAFGAVYNLAVDTDIANPDFVTDNLWPDFALDTIDVIDTSGTTPTITTRVGAEVENAYFISAAGNAGSGQYRTLFRLQNSGNARVEAGYNRVRPNGTTDAFADSSYGPSALKYPRVSDLVTTADGNFYVFSFDANESGQDPKLISIDSLRIFTRTDPDGDPLTSPVDGTEAAGPLPNSYATLGDLGTERYSMEGGTRYGNTVVVEAGGSGAADMFFFVPVANFAGSAASDYVYVYAEHGYYTPLAGSPENPSGYEFTASSGFEEWSIPIDETDRPTFEIPEPSSLILSIMGMATFMLRRRRA